MSVIAQRILQRRKQLALSQEELGFRAGTSQKQISKYERGENSPTADVLDRLADALGVTTDWLLGRTEIPDKPLRGQGDLDDLEIEAIRIIRTKNRDQRQRLIEIIKLID